MAKNGYARTFGQDLMRGEHVVGEGKRKRRANAEPAGGGGGGWKALNEKMAANRAKLQGVTPAGLTYGEFGEGISVPASGTSIFDPVLCELSYRWFCPPGGLVLDPFAGGSVRGIVAAKLGREYAGVDLRPEQIEANRWQADRICDDPMPVWHVGDSRVVVPTLDVEADFVFSCPPYADLEVYSDDPRDLSTMAYADFREAYDEIIAASCAKLKNDRFACFVVGDVRDAKGMYYGFPWHTIAAFEAAGLRLYNEAVLVTAAGSLPIRAGKQFATTRKLGKTHQNVLVFCKGDPRKATEAVGEVEFGEMAADEEWGEEL
ncbi:MAG TPA: DNA methyltransferase [Sphingomonadaceae bacterium]|nr:DNA methyltransferase [Sphingomonadaceae bacterium]